MQKKIKLDEISVVVQGPIHKKRTKKCLQSIRKQLPNAEIILSTWEGSNVDGLDYDVLILNKDVGGALKAKFKSKKSFCNLNRMILSTNEGLKKVSRKYTLKLRTDAYISNRKFLDVFDKFKNRSDKYKLFDERILASTLFSRYATNNQENKRTEIAFHLSDWWYFGLTNDVKKLLLSSELVEEPYFSNYFTYPENSNKKSVYTKFDWKFAPEQFIGYSCFSKYFDDIRMEDCSDVSEEINKKSQICLANNFIFLEYEQSGISNLKYTYSKYEPFCGDQYLDLYSFHLFEQEYKKYCNNDYEILSNNLLFKNRDTSYRILRFYKHIFKLIDQESKFISRLEQLFIGVPIFTITFIPVLWKILKEKK